MKEKLTVGHNQNTSAVFMEFKEYFLIHLHYLKICNNKRVTEIK